MLNIYFGDMEEAIYNPAVYFKNTYQDSWITNERSKAMIIKCLMQSNMWRIIVACIMATYENGNGRKRYHN